MSLNRYRKWWMGIDFGIKKDCTKHHKEQNHYHAEANVVRNQNKNQRPFKCQTRLRTNNAKSFQRETFRNMASSFSLDCYIFVSLRALPDTHTCTYVHICSIFLSQYTHTHTHTYIACNWAACVSVHVCIKEFEYTKGDFEKSMHVTSAISLRCM